MAAASLFFPTHADEPPQTLYPSNDSIKYSTCPPTCSTSSSTACPAHKRRSRSRPRQVAHSNLLLFVTDASLKLGEGPPPPSALSELLTIYEAKTELVQLSPSIGASIAASLVKPTPCKVSLPPSDSMSSGPNVFLAAQTAAQEIKNVRGRCEALWVALAQSRAQANTVAAQLNGEEDKSKEL